jgi:hypothetical protein
VLESLWRVALVGQSQYLLIVVLGLVTRTGHQKEEKKRGKERKRGKGPKRGKGQEGRGKRPKRGKGKAGRGKRPKRGRVFHSSSRRNKGL